MIYNTPVYKHNNNNDNNNDNNNYTSSQPQIASKCQFLAFIGFACPCFGLHRHRLGLGLEPFKEKEKTTKQKMKNTE